MSGKRLCRLFDSGSVAIGDKIFFEFKGNTFSAHFAEGGILHNCGWKNIKGTNAHIFKNKTFVTLSDWTESCIQDILQEYSTRYSSWKRVTHVKSNSTLDEIWKAYMENKLQHVKKPNVYQLQQLNERLMEKLAKAKEKIKDLTSENVSNEGVHPIVMNSPHGTYMVLQRMLNTGNKNIGDVKHMGMDAFKEHLNEFTIKTAIEKPNTKEGWFEQQKLQNNSDDIAQFVYNFFKPPAKPKATKRKDVHGPTGPTGPTITVEKKKIKLTIA